MQRRPSCANCGGAQVDYGASGLALPEAAEAPDQEKGLALLRSKANAIKAMQRMRNISSAIADEVTLEEVRP